MRRLAWGLLATLATGAAGAQQVYHFTEVHSGPQQYVLGYPVPRPVASLTPVDGFRDYASLHARLQSLALQHEDITAHSVGHTIHGREVWAYVTGTPGPLDVEGRPKAAFFINGTTHAREWQVPEVTTHLIERIAAGRDDAGLVRYLLDNTRLVLIPVQNIDGFLQTQRYPDQVLLGADPCWPNHWARDGRLRRKNMRGADENLFTLHDHMAGVDLNRNHPPFWATRGGPGCPSNGSSTTPTSQTYHGPGPHAHTEPEHQALLAAARLAPESRLRLAIDVHSYTQVFFSSNTGRSRLNAIQARLIDTLSRHHAAVPTHEGVANGAVYTDVPDPPNTGMGTAAEFFAYQWLVPAWTLEIEPGSIGGRQYGGLGVSGDGFILPDSQIRRVREAWAESHLVAFYSMAGPPHLARLRLFDADTGALLRERAWTPTGDGRRVLVESGSASVRPGQRLRAELSFSKPMRHRIDGTVENLPGMSVPLRPALTLRAGSTASAVDTSQGQWRAGPGLRYRDDTFVVEFEAPASSFTVDVAAQDMVGQALDADPSTPADWASGAWVGYEGDDGAAGDIGGVDRATVQIEDSALEALGVRLVHAPRQVGEGDALRLSFERIGIDEQAVRIAVTAVDLESPLPPWSGLEALPAPTVEWAAGQGGARTLEIPVPDDPIAQGERPIVVRLGIERGAEAGTFQVAATVLDNDREGAAVVRLRAATRNGVHDAFRRVGLGVAAQRSLVLDGGRQYPTHREPDMLPVCYEDQPDVPAGLTVFGNGARLQTGFGCNGGLFTLRSAAHRFERVDLERVSVAAGAQLAFGNGELRWLSGDGDAHITSARVDGMDGEGTRHLRSTVVLPAHEGIRLAGDVLLDSLTVSMPAAASPLLITAGSTDVRNSLLQRQAPPQQPICEGNLRSDGHNIASDASCGLRAIGDLENVLLPGFVVGAPTQPTGPALDAGATSCPPRDRFGAPRPQTLTADADARCDIGAVERGVNPYRGMWIPERDGHGVDMQTVGNRLFILWYTYDDAGEPTAYQAVAPLTGPRWQARLLLARRDGSTIHHAEVGDVRIDFDGNTEATLRWRFDGAAERSERIRAYLFAEGEPRFEVTGTWYPPSEAGQGVTVVRRGEVTAAVVYYYDASGALRWMLGTGDAGDAVDIEMLSFTGFCPDCDAAAMPVSTVPAGRALLHFHTPERARVDLDLLYPGAAGGHWRRERLMFEPLNDPVDNRWPLGH